MLPRTTKALGTMSPKLNRLLQRLRSRIGNDSKIRAGKTTPWRRSTKRDLAHTGIPVQGGFEKQPTDQEETCYLFRLPQELRDEIYSYLVGEVYLPKCEEWSWQGPNLPILKLDSTRAPLPEMLLLSRRITADYLQYVSEPKTLKVTALRARESFSRRPPAPNGYVSRWPTLPASCRPVETCIINYFAECRGHFGVPQCWIAQNLSLLGRVLECHFLPQMWRLQNVKLRIWIPTWCGGRWDWERFEERRLVTPLARCLNQLTTLGKLSELEVMMFRGEEAVDRWAAGDLWHQKLGTWRRGTGWDAAALRPVFKAGDGEPVPTQLPELKLWLDAQNSWLL